MNLNDINPELMRYATLNTEKEINYIKGEYHNAKSHIALLINLLQDSLKQYKTSGPDAINQQLKDIQQYIVSVYDKIFDTWPKIEHLSVGYKDIPNLEDFKATKARLSSKLIDMESVLLSNASISDKINQLSNLILN